MEDLILSILRSTPGEGWTALELAKTSSLSLAQVGDALLDLGREGILDIRYDVKPKFIAKSPRGNHAT